MTVNRTTLLDLPLPVTGTESGTWGDTTNNGLTQYLDIAIAGTLVLSTDADVTLTSTEGDSSATNIGATTAQYAILRWTATGSTTRNITALAQSKTYVVINATGGTQSIVLRGAGPTTGVTIISGEKALCVWNGSDFVKVSSSAAAGGSNTQVQYNSSGVLAGSSNLTFDGTSLTLGGNPTLSAGTANGVLYLNGSKVATSGSALTFDGTNLGLGTSPSNFTGYPSITINGTSGAIISLRNNGTEIFRQSSDTSGTYQYTQSASQPLIWGQVSSELMRLTSTGLGIGTSSPVAKLDVTSGLDPTYNTNVIVNSSVNSAKIAFNPTGVTSSGIGADATGLQFYASGANTVRATLDYSGNLGLGVTPSAWASLYKAFTQSSVNTSVYSFWDGTQPIIGMINGGFINTSYSWQYLVSGRAVSRYAQEGDGAHKWFTAPSGTANTTTITNGVSYTIITSGNQTSFGAANNNVGTVFTATSSGTLSSGTVSQNITFTQAMTLDASGNLLVGKTSSTYAASNRSTFEINNTDSSIIALQYGGANGYYLQANSTAGYLWNSANTPLVFGTNNTERARITSGGDLLVGDTSAGYNLANRGLIELNGTSSALFGLRVGAANKGYLLHEGTNLYLSNDANGAFIVNTNNTERARITSGGNLLVGGTTNTSMATVQISVGSTSTASSALQFLSTTSGANGIYFGDGTSGTDRYRGYLEYNHTSDFMVFATAATERARITSGGYFKASDTGTYSNAGLYHEFYQTGNNSALLVRATNATFSNYVITIQGDRTTTNTSYYLIEALNGNATGRFFVADSGNATNTNGSYGTISDAKMKTDIVDAGSQWADIKAIRFRKFKMKNDPSGLLQLGVVAQELEQTSPGLVDEHVDRDAEGNDLGTTTKSVKTSILLMKAAKALQEAMARIETLEAKVSALEGN